MATAWIGLIGAHWLVSFDRSNKREDNGCCCSGMWGSQEGQAIWGGEKRSGEPTSAEQCLEVLLDGSDCVQGTEEIDDSVSGMHVSLVNESACGEALRLHIRNRMYWQGE